MVLIKGFTAITAASTNLATYDDDDDDVFFIHDDDDDTHSFTQIWSGYVFCMLNVCVVVVVVCYMG